MHLSRTAGPLRPPGHLDLTSVATTTDFLRWTRYGDQAAGARLSTDAHSPALTRYQPRPAH